MSDRMSAYISIGGRLARSRVPELLKAITAAGVSLEWGDSFFTPASAKELLAFLHDGRLWLCDEQALYGEFPNIEALCRRLRLPYTRYSEGKYEYDPEVVDWRPGMAEVLTRTASNYGTTTYVPTEDVKKVLQHLEAGRVSKAKKLLRALCPEVPELPPFQIV